MERLTRTTERLNARTRRRAYYKVRENAMAFYWRLKAYEDTGLTPEQIKAVFDDDALMKLVAHLAGITLDRLKALLQAEKAFVTISAPGPTEQGEKGD